MVIGYTPIDKRWREMKKIYDACKEANVAIPQEVVSYFNGLTPPNDPEGIAVCIDRAVTTDEFGTVLYVDLTLVPENVTKIRVRHLGR